MRQSSGGSSGPGQGLEDEERFLSNGKDGEHYDFICVVADSLFQKKVGNLTLKPPNIPPHLLEYMNPSTITLTTGDAPNLAYSCAD